MILMSLAISLIVAAVTTVLVWVFLRRIVPTNMVHIVQSAKARVAYGKGMESGNAYYQWPSWFPKIGVTVTEFSLSIFQIGLSDYESYDSARVPFMTDTTAFFRVDDVQMAAERISVDSGIRSQLEDVLRSALRRLMATNTLEFIMESRSELGEQFTKEVAEDLKEWGIVPVKNIEIMDVKDKPGCDVIKNIMAKEQSRIEKESRIAVAENLREAELKEIDAKRTIAVQQQDAMQQVGIRTAEKDRTIGIANEQVKQEVQTQAKITAEVDMEVLRVQQIKAAEIAKDMEVIRADQDRQVKVIESEAQRQADVIVATGDLEASKLDAEGIRAVGIAEADAEKAKLMAPVETQITLAKEIGTNKGYQDYLVTIKQVEVSGEVGKELAKAMQNADLKVIANSGDVQTGVASLGDIFTAKGGTNLTGMLSALAQSPEGKALVDKVVGHVSPPIDVEQKPTQKKKKPE